RNIVAIFGAVRYFGHEINLSVARQRSHAAGHFFCGWLGCGAGFGAAIQVGSEVATPETNTALTDSDAG
ncbi:MAG: hypothetical protein B7Z57_03565, partial [Acidiphilium sp. 37-60-79]